MARTNHLYDEDKIGQRYSSWEQNGNPAVGTLKNLTDFLQARCQIFERIDARSKQRDAVKDNDSEKQQNLVIKQNLHKVINHRR